MPMSRMSLATATAVAVLSAQPSVAAEHVVTMSGATYQPAQLTAAVGDTVRFVNDDALAHNVFVPTALHALDLGSQDPDTEKTLLLTAPGRFEVECVLHDHMLMTVEVTP